MAQQIQCPKCGNYRITKPGSFAFGCLALLIGFVAWGYAALGLLSGSGEVLLVVIGITVVIFVVMRLVRNQQPWVCKSCGYQWKSSAQPGVS